VTSERGRGNPRLCRHFDRGATGLEPRPPAWAGRRSREGHDRILCLERTLPRHGEVGNEPRRSACLSSRLVHHGHGFQHFVRRVSARFLGRARGAFTSSHTRTPQCANVTCTDWGISRDTSSERMLSSSEGACVEIIAPRDRISFKKCPFAASFYGPGRIRTCDLGIKSPLLCQLSYRPAKVL
jgi:hypothetical protein